MHARLLGGAHSRRPLTHSTGHGSGARAREWFWGTEQCRGEGVAWSTPAEGRYGVGSLTKRGTDGRGDARHVEGEEGSGANTEAKVSELKN